MLEVTLYERPCDPKPVVLDSVDYVSLYNPETHGKPALVAPGRPGEPRSSIGERVLYINTARVPMFEIVRVEDEG